MKWNILLGTVVLGFGLCTQSYGFELLDRMLGVGVAQKGCGCDGKGAHQKGGCGAHQKDGKGCGVAQKGCGAAQKGCGLGGLLGGCGVAQKGCDGKGAHQKGGACQKDGKGACQKGCGPCQKDGKGACQKGCGAAQKGLGGLFGGCGVAQKGCGGKGACQKGGACQKDGKGACQKDGKGACQKGCGRVSLLDSLFGCGGGKGKGKGKGCDAHQKDGVKYDDKDGDVEDAPTPPAPVVDPSAFLHTRRPVVQATSYVR